MENSIENATQELHTTQENAAQAEKETNNAAEVSQEENVTPAETNENEANDANVFVAQDVNTLDREALVKYLQQTIEKQPINVVETIVRDVRERFNKLSHEEREARREKFLADGNAEQDFDRSPDILDQNMKNLLNLYNERSKEYRAALDKEYKQNALLKNNIIENITALLEKGDSYENSKQIRELTQQWKTIGRVPATEANEINIRYKHCLDQYHHNIALSREMREIDHKRNYERKVELCEQAEKLAEQPSAAKAFHTIQHLHDEWKQIGAVAPEDREAIWQRFKNATTAVNDRFHKFVEDNREKEKAVLDRVRVAFQGTARPHQNETQEKHNDKDDSKAVCFIEIFFHRLVLGKMTFCAVKKTGVSWILPTKHRFKDTLFPRNCLYGFHETIRKIAIGRH